MIEEDHCMYIKWSKKNFVIPSLYFDDILLVGNNKELIIAIKEWLSSSLQMKDMDEANYMLRVNIFRNRSK